MASCFHKHDPFRIAKQIFRGYKEEFSLNDGEIKIVKLIICARTLQAYVLSGMDAEDDPEKEYLTLERHESIELCRHLWNIEDNEFLTKLML